MYLLKEIAREKPLAKAAFQIYYGTPVAPSLTLIFFLFEFFFS